MPLNNQPNHYSILGVATNAEDVVIRAAYRALVQRYHPDKFSNQGKENDLSAKSEAAKRIAQMKMPRKKKLKHRVRVKIRQNSSTP